MQSRFLKPVCATATRSLPAITIGSAYLVHWNFEDQILEDLEGHIKKHSARNLEIVAEWKIQDRQNKKKENIRGSLLDWGEGGVAHPLNIACDLSCKFHLEKIHNSFLSCIHHLLERLQRSNFLFSFQSYWDIFIPGSTTKSREPKVENVAFFVVDKYFNWRLLWKVDATGDLLLK